LLLRRCRCHVLRLLRIARLNNGESEVTLYHTSVGACQVLLNIMFNKRGLKRISIGTVP
jgi:hypothetical protein